MRTGPEEHRQLVPNTGSNPDNSPVLNKWDFGRNGEGDQRLEPSNPYCRDWLWALLFVLHICGVFILFVMEVRRVHINAKPIAHLMTILLPCAALSLLTGFFWLKIIQWQAVCVIQSMLVIVSIFLILYTTLMFLAGAVGPGIVFLIFTVLFLLFSCGVQRRIPFAAAMIDIASEVIQEYPSTIGIALAFGSLLVGWLLVWGLMASAGAVAHRSLGIWLFSVLSLYWTWQVIKMSSHVTIAGVTATWYFSTDSPPAACGSLKRALTSSFGSICLGSLIVALLEVLYALVRSQVDPDSVVGCLCLCILSCIESLIQYFNIYAFAQVAIYGFPYIEAAKRTWQLFQARGFDALINDDLTYLVALAGAFFAGIVCAGLGAGLAATFHGAPLIVGGLFGFLVGILVCDVVMNVLRSAVVTLFVCWAEDPNAFSDNHPDEHTKVEDARAALSA